MATGTTTESMTMVAASRTGGPIMAALEIDAVLRNHVILNRNLIVLF
jgi:hypothetical protein